MFALLFWGCESITNNDEGDDTDTLTQPELLTPLNEATGQSVDIDLKWQKIRGAKEYNIQIATIEDFSTTVIDTLVEGTSYSATNLEYETTYFWKVLPLKNRNSGPWSEVWSFTTGSNDAETITTELLSPADGEEVEQSDLHFEWEAVENAENYIYQIAADTSFDETVYDSVLTSTSVKISDLRSNREYAWRVSPVLDSQKSGWSEVRTVVIVEAETPAAPKVVLISPEDNATDISTDPVFEWEEATGYTDYQIQIHTASDFSNPVIDETVSSTSFEATNLDYLQTYYWRVQVVDESEDVWSDIRSFETKAEPVTTPPPSKEGFVQVQNGDFILNGEVFRFAGTNAYYLPNYEKINSGVVDRALDLFEETGVNVVRMWGFYDGFDCGYSAQDPSENVIQTSPGVYSEEALQDLDRVIAKGKEKGIRFIMPFINYWDQLGGLCQYNTWAGASNPSTNMEFFMNNEQTQKWFRDYINMLLNRVNTVTGVAYKDEPAIFGWQIINEGRNSGADPQVLRDWYQEIAQYIKSIDSNHLLSTGEEGFDEGTPDEYSQQEYSNTYALRANEGTSFIMNTSIPEIDFGNAHWYPSDYGFGSSTENMLQAQKAWFSDHQAIAESYGKPFIIGEYGYAGWGNETVEQIYNELYAHAEATELDGNLLWQLVADGTKCWEFGGNICYPDGRADADLYQPYKEHVATMRASK